MDRILNTMKCEILSEASGSRRLSPMEFPATVTNLKRNLARYDRFMSIMLSPKYCNWYYSNVPNYTASIGWDSKDRGKIKLTLGPRTINGSQSVMAFVLAHEFAHFFRNHLSKHMFAAMPDSDAANIVEDALIDDDILKAGTFAGFKVATPFPVFTLKTKEFGGMEQNCLEVLAGEEYKGAPVTKEVYKWYKKNEQKIEESLAQKNPNSGEDQNDGNQQNQEQDGNDEGDGGGGQGKPVYPKVGDIVVNNETGEYGRVTSINPTTNQIDGIIPIATKAEAEAEAMKSGKKLIGGV